MVEVIAREIGEGGEREPNAVESALVDPERRRLHGEMRDAAPREVVERAMQFDRPRRRQRAIMRARASTTPTVPSDAASNPSESQI